MGEMTAIHEITGPIADRLDQLKAKVETEAAERRRRFGWPDGAECSWCGDTGTNPIEGRDCFCAAGIALGEQRRNGERREAAWNDLIPARFRHYRIDGCPVAVADQVHAWIERQPWQLSSPTHGQNLLIAGPVGTGKTGAAVSCLRLLTELPSPPKMLFASVPALLDAIRPSGDDPVALNLARAVDVLVLDDLGAERSTPWAIERLYVLGNDRYEQLLPTIITTNGRVNDLRGQVGDRTWSRLQESAAVVEMPGSDRRKGGSR